MKITRESEYIEFKETLGQVNRALESLAAMINKHGQGIIYFGVADDGEIKGITIGNKTQKDISQLVSEKIRPIVIPHISEETYGDKTILKLEANGTNIPYTCDGNYFIRSGSENRKIDQETMKLLLFKNSNDNMVEIESLNQELTFNQLWQLYLLKNYTIDKNTFYKNTGLLTSNNKFNLLANLLSDNSDYSIKVVRFSGSDKSNMIFRNEYGYKCLLLAMQQALDFTFSFNETRVDLSHSTRREIKLFNESCLREAWYNACLHTRWDKMVPPAIYIFDDRIEIISTGGLPVDFSEDDFFNGISHPINKQLQKIMGQLDYVEQTGHGVPEIIKHYGKDAFTISENYINVTLKFPFPLTRGESDFSSLSKSEIKVLKAINDMPTITLTQLSKVTELGVSRISNIIKSLKLLGKIERVGSNKDGYWKVN